MAPDAVSKSFPLSVSEMMAVSEANWDARTPVHVASNFYAVNGRTPATLWFAPFGTDLVRPLFSKRPPDRMKTLQS
jgi:hypothetical protein